MRPVREKWGKRYIIVIRSENGRIVSWRRWRHDFTLKMAVKKYKEDNALPKDLRIYKFSTTGTREYTDFSMSPRIRSVKFQAYAECYIGKELFQARSLQYAKGEITKKAAMDEALASLYRKVAYKIFNNSDEEAGSEYLTNKKIIVRKGYIYYR
jgi:hypothetical protein